MYTNKCRTTFLELFSSLEMGKKITTSTKTNKHLSKLKNQMPRVWLLGQKRQVCINTQRSFGYEGPKLPGIKGDYSIVSHVW